MATKAEFFAAMAHRFEHDLASEPPRREPLSPPLPAQPDSDLTARFADEFAKLGGTVSRCDTLDSLHAALRIVVDSVPVAPLIIADFDGGASWQIASALEGRDIAAPANAGFRDRAAQSRVGIVAADFGIAETGTLVVTASPARPRTVSLLPRTCIALLRASNIVPTMAVAFRRLGLAAGPSMPSAVQLITGASRSADIENDLTIGLHGPSDLHVLILDAHAPAKG